MLITKRARAWPLAVWGVSPQIPTNPTPCRSLLVTKEVSFAFHFLHSRKMKIPQTRHKHGGQVTHTMTCTKREPAWARIHIRARGHHQLERLAVPALRRQVRRRRAALPIDNIHIRCCVTMRVYTCILWVDFGSRWRLHGPASPFGRCGTRVANPTPRQNEPQGEVPDR